MKVKKSPKTVISATEPPSFSNKDQGNNKQPNGHSTKKMLERLESSPPSNDIKSIVEVISSGSKRRSSEQVSQPTTRHPTGDSNVCKLRNRSYSRDARRKGSSRAKGLNNIRFQKNGTQVYVVDLSRDTTTATHLGSDNQIKIIQVELSPTNGHLQTANGLQLTRRECLCDELHIYTASPKSQGNPEESQAFSEQVVTQAGPCQEIKAGFYYLPAKSEIPGSFTRSQNLALPGRELKVNVMAQYLKLDMSTKYETAHIFGDASIIGKLGLLPCLIDQDRKKELESDCESDVSEYIKITINHNEQDYHFYVPKSFDSQRAQDRTSTAPQSQIAINILLKEIADRKGKHELVASWRRCIELMADEMNIKNGGSFQVNIGPQTRYNYGLATFACNSKEIFRIYLIQVLHKLGYNIYFGGNATFLSDHYPLKRKFFIRAEHKIYPKIAFDFRLDPKQSSFPMLYLLKYCYRKMMRMDIPSWLVWKAMYEVTRDKVVSRNVIVSTPRVSQGRPQTCTNAAIQKKVKVNEKKGESQECLEQNKAKGFVPRSASLGSWR